MIGIDGGGEAGGHGDDFVARPDPPVLQLRRGQGAEGHQVGRRAGIDQQGRIAIHALGQRALELLGEAAGGEPEIEAGLDGQLQFFGIEHAAGIADRALAGHERPRGEGRLVVFRDQVGDLAAYFFGVWHYSAPWVICSSIVKVDSFFFDHQRPFQDLEVDRIQPLSQHAGYRVRATRTSGDARDADRSASGA